MFAHERIEVWPHLHHTPTRLAHIVVNAFKRGRKKIELAIEKVILREKKQLGNLFFLSLVIFHQKEKIVIHISNIRTFNIKVF